MIRTTTWAVLVWTWCNGLAAHAQDETVHEWTYLYMSCKYRLDPHRWIAGDSYSLLQRKEVTTDGDIALLVKGTWNRATITLRCDYFLDLGPGRSKIPTSISGDEAPTRLEPMKRGHYYFLRAGPFRVVLQIIDWGSEHAKWYVNLKFIASMDDDFLSSVVSPELRTHIESASSQFVAQEQAAQAARAERAREEALQAAQEQEAAARADAHRRQRATAVAVAIFVLAIVVGLIGVGLLTYNKLRRLRNRAHARHVQIDLVSERLGISSETMLQYAQSAGTHERSTQVGAAAARGSSLRMRIGGAEATPGITATPLFARAQEEVGESEAVLADAVEAWIAAANVYEDARTSFPGMLLAALLPQTFPSPF